MEKQYYQEMVDNLTDLIQRGELQDKEIFLFGHGNATEEMLTFLQQRKVPVAYILDNNLAKQGMVCQGVMVESPTKLFSDIGYKKVVLIAARAFSQMENQLKQLGYHDEIIRIVNYNTFAEYSLEDNVFLDKLERMERGRKTLNSIRMRYTDEYLCICPYNAIGDVYQALAYLPSYLEQIQRMEYVVIVVGEVCRQVVELFGSNSVVTISQQEMDELVQAILFIQEENCIIAHHDRPYTNDMIRYLDSHFLSFEDFYRCGVYGLEKETLPAVPHNQVEYQQKNEVVRGNTVILSPYAKSMVQLPDQYWINLAVQYRNSGYMVCTNIAGDEKEIMGTVPLRIPISQMKSAVEHAGTFIGIRSGLCDIINSAACRKIVIFPDCIYSTTNIKVKDFFAMQGWKTILY